MAIGDALAVSLLEKRGFRPDDFAALHPAGRLGNKLLRVEHLMHSAMPCRVWRRIRRCLLCS